jgi:hypothetical protein
LVKKAVFFIFNFSVKPKQLILWNAIRTKTKTCVIVLIPVLKKEYAVNVYTVTEKTASYQPAFSLMMWKKLMTDR